jgi:hypothetical protein
MVPTRYGALAEWERHMSRHQFVRRILDAVELRGGDLRPVTDIKVGDEVMFLDPSADYVIEAVETDEIGKIRHRARKDTLSLSYSPDEYLYVRSAK